MKAVVVGGAGFIGSHLVDALNERGDDVRVVDSANDGKDILRGELWQLYDADVVFHCAAIARTPWAIADPELCWNTNLMGSVRVLEACRRGPVKRIVLSSSNIVYAGTTPYRASKLAMEEAAKVYNELYGLSTICLRYANTYGPRQREDGIGPNVFASLRKSLRQKGYIEVTGDGHQTRDFIHVSDVVRANLMAAESEVTGEFDICTGHNWSMNQIADLIGAEIRYVPEREGDIKHIRQDLLPALEQLNFLADVPLNEGIWDSFPERVAA